MKIPRAATDKRQYDELVRECKKNPTTENLNQLEDLLEVEPSILATRKGVRDRVSELESEVAKDKRFQKRVAEELADPENRTPMKSKKYAKKLATTTRRKS